MHQQEKEKEERLSSGSLAAAYCIGLLTPTSSHTAATIALNCTWSHILFQLYLQCWTNIWNWWEFGKTKCVFFFLKSTKFSLVWTFWADLWHLSNEGAWFVFTMCVRKVLNIGSQSPRKSGGEDSHQKSFSSSALAGKSYICDTRNQFLAQ